jgi:hypothetical protein
MVCLLQYVLVLPIMVFCVDSYWYLLSCQNEAYRGVTVRGRLRSLQLRYSG